jgi:hypothetical protein
VHDVDGTYNTLGTGNVLTTASVPSDHPDSKLGGSAMAALQINNIPTGAGRKDRASVSFQDLLWVDQDTIDLIRIRHAARRAFAKW